MRKPLGDLTILRQLQELTTVPDITIEEHDTALAVLDDAMDMEVFGAEIRTLLIEPDMTDVHIRRPDFSGDSPPRRRRLRLIRGTMAIAAVLGLAVIFATVTWITRSEPVTALDNIAHAIEPLPPEAFGETQLVWMLHEEGQAGGQMPDGEYVFYFYTRSMTERYDGAGNVERTEVWGEPEFLNPEHERYRDQIREQDNFGEPMTMVFPFPDAEFVRYLTDSAEDFGQVTREMYDLYGDPSLPFGLYALGHVHGMYITTLPTPAERAAMLSFLASIDELEQEETDAGVSIRIAYTWSNPRVDGVTTDTWTEEEQLDFDRNGWLIGNSLTYVDGAPIVAEHDVLAEIPPGFQNSSTRTAPQPDDG